MRAGLLQAATQSKLAMAMAMASAWKPKPPAQGGTHRDGLSMRYESLF